jgi:citrate synthase
MEYIKGLEGVIAGETSISNVEGDEGRLSYRGYDIRDLVKLDYERVIWLLLFGDLPDENDRQMLCDFLAEFGALKQSELAVLQSFPLSLHPMRMLQSMIPLLQLDEKRTLDGLSDEGGQGLQIIARMPALIAAFHRRQQSLDMVVFDPSMNYLENFMQMFSGEVIQRHVEMLRTTQILQMEHSFNAGTFAARVVASTLAPVDAVFSAAAGALFGKLHGGADQAALEDAKRVGCADQASAFIDDLFEHKGLLMGMGHREYRKVDPRASILKPMAESLCRGTPFQADYEVLDALEEAFNKRMQEKGKEVWANVEFYKGAVYEALGIPIPYFTALFALSRSVGWLAHFNESRQDNRIIRPRALYVGQALREIG